MRKNTRHRLASVLAIAGLSLATAVLAGCGPQTVNVAPAANTVTASGMGTIQAAPDEATMSFGVTRSSKDAKALLADTNKAAEKIVAALKKAGVAEEDIQTQNVSLYPQTDFESGKPVVTGYQASISVTVKVRDLAKLGAIISAGSDAGANTVNGPSFDIAEDSPFTARAIDKAVADARRNAEAMAKAADKSVGDVLSISDSTVAPIQPFAAELSLAPSAAKDAIAVNPGQLDVTSSVIVIFELK